MQVPPDDQNERDENGHEDSVIIVPIPAFVTVLLALENEKGAPLTEREVLRARDVAACMTMCRSHLEEIARVRGYDDIDMENAWDEWQAIRESLIGAGS